MDKQAIEDDIMSRVRYNSHDLGEMGMKDNET